MSTDSKNSTFPTSTGNPSGSGVSSSTGGLSSGGSGMSSGSGGGYPSGSSSSGASSSSGMSGGSLSGGSNMSGGMNSGDGTVHRVAQAAHQAVDKLEQTLGSSGDRVMSMQQEYGEMAREHVKTNPLQSIGIAFAVGVVFSKVFMR